jgi:hypothetical protein
MDAAGRMPLDMGLMQIIERYLAQAMPTATPTAPLLHTLLRVVATLLAIEIAAREMPPGEADGFVTVYLGRLALLVEDVRAHMRPRPPTDYI